MTLPKLLPSLTVSTSNDTFAFTQGAAHTAVITSGEYGSILEVLADLEDKLEVTDADFSVSISADGFVTISHLDTVWSVTWALTDNALEKMLGFVGTESVTGAGPYVLTATRRPQYAWYSPTGGQWPADRRRIDAREQDTDAGDLCQYASSAEHVYRSVTFSLLSQAQMESGGSDSDGDSGTVNWTDSTLLDFWRYVKDQTFRFYEDRADGTVASPGTEGVEYVTCRRLRDEWVPMQPDEGDYSFFNVTIAMKIVGS